MRKERKPYAKKWKKREKRIVKKRRGIRFHVYWESAAVKLSDAIKQHNVI